MRIDIEGRRWGSRTPPACDLRLNLGIARRVASRNPGPHRKLGIHSAINVSDVEDAFLSPRRDYQRCGRIMQYEGIRVMIFTSRMVCHPLGIRHTYPTNAPELVVGGDVRP